MAKIKLKQVDQISRKKIVDAYDSFMRHCKLKNLAPYSILYYEKNVKFFLDSLPNVKYVDEINQDLIADFINMTRKYINLYGNDIQRDFDRLNPLNNILAKS